MFKFSIILKLMNHETALDEIQLQDTPPFIQHSLSLSIIAFKKLNFLHHS
jgi:hypothetical protein